MAEGSDSYVYVIGGEIEPEVGVIRFLDDGRHGVLDTRNNAYKFLIKSGFTVSHKPSSKDRFASEQEAIDAWLNPPVCTVCTVKPSSIWEPGCSSYMPAVLVAIVLAAYYFFCR